MKRIALLALAGLFALTSCCNSDKPVKKDISVQLYSIRDVIGNPELYAQNHEEAFKALAEMGYTSVEAACYSDGKLYTRSKKRGNTKRGNQKIEKIERL